MPKCSKFWSHLLFFETNMTGAEIVSTAWRMLHADQPNTFLHVIHQNTSNLWCWFHFWGQKYIFGIIPSPQLTCTGLCTHVLCSKHASWKVICLFWPWKCNQPPQLPMKRHITCKKKCPRLTPMAVSARAHTRLVQVKAFLLLFYGTKLNCPPKLHRHSSTPCIIKYNQAN